MKRIKSFGLMLITACITNISLAQNMEKTVDVGGAAMYPSRNIIENAVNSKDHTTLVAAVKAAGSGGNIRRCRSFYCICSDQ